MTDTDNDDIEETEPVEAIETDVEDIRTMIRDEIERVLHAIPGEGSVTDIKKDLPDDDEPLSLRAVESSVRKIVEEAMEPLRAAQKKPAKKPATRKEPEATPTPAPVVKDTRTRIQTFLWGADQ